MARERCARPEDLGYDDIVLASKTWVCEDTPSTFDPKHEVVLNALHSSMPQCDLVDEPAFVTSVPDGRRRFSNCNVYCAQRSCHAAVGFMNDHAEALDQGCEAITYLRNGALSMAEEKLSDGAKCHASVIQHNEAADGTCLTCTKRQETAIETYVDGSRDYGARYNVTDGVVPDWYHRSDISTLLPPQFTCDARYKNTPTPHAPEGARQRVAITLDRSRPAEATLAYWAADAHPEGEVQEPHVAYGSFDNSGIVQCSERRCEFELRPPGRYTAEGRVFRPHVHFSEWKGDHWSPMVETVSLSRTLQ